MEKEINHAERALELCPNDLGFINVKRDDQGRAVVSFIIQSAPVSEVGVNGLQAVNILEYVQSLFTSLNDVYSCTENAFTITKIQEAIHWQTVRTKDRQRRGVEGINAL